MICSEHLENLKCKCLICFCLHNSAVSRKKTAPDYWPQQVQSNGLILILWASRLNPQHTAKTRLVRGSWYWITQWWCSSPLDHLLFMAMTQAALPDAVEDSRTSAEAARGKCVCEATAVSVQSKCKSHKQHIKTQTWFWSINDFKWTRSSGVTVDEV